MNNMMLYFHNILISLRLNLIIADAVWSDEWQVYQEHEYKFFEDGTISASNAHLQCIHHGGLLVSINSQEVGILTVL